MYDCESKLSVRAEWPSGKDEDNNDGPNCRGPEFESSRGWEC
jgi:hypothetical protein